MLKRDDPFRGADLVSRDIAPDYDFGDSSQRAGGSLYIGTA